MTHSTNLTSAINIKSYSAQLYTASTNYGPLSLPWFSDYIHLIFWFFFLTSFILTVWLMQTFFLTIRGGETRFPIRETRGFSRAQTGDSFTAVIPMCWSITMLMHASTHSSNFDENTDSTTLSLSIIAYQWGWNYFFPIDTITKLVSTSNTYLNTNNISIKTNNSDNLKLLNNVVQKIILSNNSISKNNLYNIVTQKTVFDSNTAFLTDTGRLWLFDLQLNNNTFDKHHLIGSILNFENVNHNQNSIRNLSTKYTDIKSAFQKNDFHTINSMTNLTLPFIKKYTISPLILQKNNGFKISNLLEDLDSANTSKKFFSEISTSRQVAPLDKYDDLIHLGGLAAKIRVNAGVCLPSDIPMHIICSSKDVVHSWAIPGLSIKIDCIPGYNCHRRLLIRWRGLFWGQCMEVCGRYHHWMPLLLKITSIDIFISWCLAFLS